MHVCTGTVSVTVVSIVQAGAAKTERRDVIAIAYEL